MSKKEQKLPDTHKMGKHVDYDLIDGKYHVAPMYVERFDRLRDMFAAVDDVIAAVSKHCSKDYEVLRKEQRMLWDQMGEDFGVDFKAGEWHYLNGVIEPVPKKEPKA